MILLERGWYGESSSSADTEDSWEKDDGERTATPVWAETDEEDLDDADDSPYVYRSQADIRPLEEESEDESESDGSSWENNTKEKIDYHRSIHSICNKITLNECIAIWCVSNLYYSIYIQ